MSTVNVPHIQVFCFSYCPILKSPEFHQPTKFLYPTCFIILPHHLINWQFSSSLGDILMLKQWEWRTCDQQRSSNITPARFRLGQPFVALSCDPVGQWHPQKRQPKPPVTPICPHALNSFCTNNSQSQCVDLKIQEIPMHRGQLQHWVVQPLSRRLAPELKLSTQVSPTISS